MNLNFILTLTLIILLIQQSLTAQNKTSVTITCNISAPHQCNSGYYYKIIGDGLNQVICVKKGKICNTSLSATVTLANCTVNFLSQPCQNGLCFQASNLWMIMPVDNNGNVSATDTCPIDYDQNIICTVNSESICNTTHIKKYQKIIKDTTKVTTRQRSPKDPDRYISQFIPNYTTWTESSGTNQTILLYKKTIILNPDSYTTINKTYIVQRYNLTQQIKDSNLTRVVFHEDFINQTTVTKITVGYQSGSSVVNTLRTFTNFTILMADWMNNKNISVKYVTDSTTYCLSQCPYKNSTRAITKCSIDHFGDKWNSTDNTSCCFYFLKDKTGPICASDVRLFNTSNKVINWTLSYAYEGWITKCMLFLWVLVIQLLI